jgi:hypothetical protein
VAGAARQGSGEWRPGRDGGGGSRPELERKGPYDGSGRGWQVEGGSGGAESAGGEELGRS